MLLFGFYELPLWPGSLSFILGFFAWLSIYEIGYLENDALTIRKEAKPNIRISQGDIHFIQQKYWRIIVFRLIVFLTILGILVGAGLFSQYQLKIFVLMVIAGRMFFLLHNQIRSRWNILTYFLLCVSKYWVFPMVFLGLDYGTEPYWVIFLAFPLLRTLEHAMKPKYQFVKLKNWAGSLDGFRVKYYGFWLVVAVFFSTMLFDCRIFVYCTLYFFLFRLGIFFLIRTGKYARVNES